MATWLIEELATGEREILYTGNGHTRKSSGKCRPEVAESTIIEWVVDNANLGDVVVMPGGGLVFLPWCDNPYEKWGRVLN